MDCEHRQLALMSEDENALFVCSGRRCTKEYWEREVVILTKAQDKLRGDVMTAGRKLVIFIDDNAIWGDDYAISDPIARIEHSPELKALVYGYFKKQKALDALTKESERWVRRW